MRSTSAALLLNVLSAVAAFAAAVLWFKSAFGRLPPIVAYLDAAPRTDPFFLAVEASAYWNRLAAAAAGVAAVLQSGAILLSARRTALQHRRANERDLV